MNDRFGPVLIAVTMFAGGIMIASCRDNPVAPNFGPPDSRVPPRAYSWASGGGSLGAHDITVPSVNDPNSGLVDWETTGVGITAANTYARVTVDGTVNVSTHPAYYAFLGSDASLNGQAVGPGGAGQNELRVSLRQVNAGGGTLWTQQFLTDSSGHVSVTRKFTAEGDFEAKRTGAYASASCSSSTGDCPNGENYWWTPGYTLAGTQTMEVESFEPFEFDFPSGEVVEGSTLSASATPHAYVDSLGYSRWYFRVGDTLATPQGLGGTLLWTNCEKLETCSFVPGGPGRLYLRTRVYMPGSGYVQEIVNSEVVWPVDYVFPEEPDSVVEIGEVTVENPGGCGQSVVMMARSCSGGGDSTTYNSVFAGLVCHGAQRGSSGRCRLMLSPSEVPYDSVLWTFVSTDTLVTDTVSEKGDTLWSGILVAAGGVTAELHIGSTSTQVASSYSVTDRPWTWTSSHVDTAQAALGQFDGCFTTEIGLTVGTDCVAYGPGNLFTPGSLAAGFSMDTATGPNAGLWYVSSASKGMFLRSQVAKKLRSDATKYSVTGDATVINDCTATFGTPIPPQNIRGVNHDCRQTPGYNQLWDSAWAHESAHMDTALVEANLPVNDLHAAWQLLLANDSSTLDYRIRSVQNAVHGRIFGASLSIHIGDTVFYPLYIYDAAREGFVWDSIGVER